MGIEHRIRQAILRELKAAGGAPLKWSELAELATEPALLRDIAAGEQEWDKLKMMGYIEAVPGFGGEYCRITVRGLQQSEPEFVQDAFIWGPGAR